MWYSAETTGMRAFFCEDEYRYFLDRLREGQGRFVVALHAYVLMTNHVHVLMRPRDTAGISRLMQRA
jgi:putative transposase